MHVSMKINRWVHDQKFQFPGNSNKIESLVLEKLQYNKNTRYLITTHPVELPKMHFSIRSLNPICHDLASSSQSPLSEARPEPLPQ